MASSKQWARPTVNLGTTVTTTNATQTVAGGFTTEADHSYFVEAKFLGVETADHNETSSYWRQATFQNDGGTLTQVGSTRTIGTDNETTAGWDATLAASGTEIIAQVTGAAATTINWRVETTIMQIE